MRLEQLYINFGTSTPEAQLEHIAAYRLRRAQDMLKPATIKKKSKAASKEKLELTEEEKAVAKLLGLKPKDILALRALQEVEPEEEEVSGELFDEGTFEEGEE